MDDKDQEIERLKAMLDKRLDDAARKIITSDELKNMDESDALWLEGILKSALDCVDKDMWEDAFWWMEKAFRLYVAYTSKRIEQMKNDA